MKQELVRINSIDDIEQVGILYAPNNITNKIVIHVHGLNGNFYENKFLDTLAEMGNEKATDGDWINKVIGKLKNEIDVDELEGKINKVLSKYPIYVAGESIENDLLR